MHGVGENMGKSLGGTVRKECVEQGSTGKRHGEGENIVGTAQGKGHVDHKERAWGKGSLE